MLTLAHWAAQRDLQWYSILALVTVQHSCATSPTAVDRPTKVLVLY